MGREYYKKEAYSTKILEVIAANHNELKHKLCPIDMGNYAGRSTEDVFSDTIAFIIQDKAVIDKPMTDEEILKHFEYRYKMVYYQVVKDSSLELTTSREVEYKGDNLITT